MQRPQGTNDERQSLQNRLRNALISAAKGYRFGFAKMAECTRLEARISALMAMHEMGVPTQSPRQVEGQSDRNYYYNMYIGLLSVINESVFPEAAEKYALARRRWFHTILQLFPGGIEKDTQEGIDAIR